MTERPDVPPGTVVRLDSSDWKYGTAEAGALVVRVEMVRWDLVSPTAPEGFVWIRGQRIRPSDDVDLGYVELFVRMDALAQSVES